jgi:hypothetical protein
MQRLSTIDVPTTHPAIRAMGSKRGGQASNAPSGARTIIGNRNPIRDQIPSVLKFRPYGGGTFASIASGYRALASEIANGAESMFLPDSVAQHIAVFHAIELALKGYLIHSGLTEKKLREKFSHDLEKLFAKAKARGLVVNLPHVDEIIAWSNEYHKDGLIRYDIGQFSELPKCEVLFPIVDVIVDAIPIPGVRAR